MRTRIVTRERVMIVSERRSVAPRRSPSFPLDHPLMPDCRRAGRRDDGM
jgi:hypothetical protein